MPAKNALKEYEEGAFYHIYNRGVEKREIFIDEQDYKVFLSNLKFYLTSPDLRGQTPKMPPSQQLKNYAGQLDLLAFCLMPNHFHLLVKQYTREGIYYFMKSAATKYSMYFNKRYERVGGLFQGRYKAVKIDTEEQLVYVSKYIHANPWVDKPVEYPYSSYDNYLGRVKQDWVKPAEITGYFSQVNYGRNSYREFVESDLEDCPLRRLVE